jgi:hypothetical protein
MMMAVKPKHVEAILFIWLYSPQWARASSFTRFLVHTRRTTVGRTPLDEWSARRRDLYLATHNTHNRQTPMPAAGFETANSAGERPQTNALDSAATGIGRSQSGVKHIIVEMWACWCFKDSYTKYTGGTADGGTVVKIQIGRSLVWFQMVSLEFSIDIILPIALWPWGRLSFQQKWVPGAFPGGKGGRCVGLTTLPPSCAAVM